MLTCSHVCCYAVRNAQLLLLFCSCFVLVEVILHAVFLYFALFRNKNPFQQFGKMFVLFLSPLHTDLMPPWFSLSNRFLTAKTRTPAQKTAWSFSPSFVFLPAGLEMKKPLVQHADSETNLLLVATNNWKMIRFFDFEGEAATRKQWYRFWVWTTSVVGPLFPRQSIAQSAVQQCWAGHCFFVSTLFLSTSFGRPFFALDSVQTPVSFAPALALSQPSPLKQGNQSLHHQTARWNMSFTPELY